MNGVLKRLFNYELNQSSPVMEETIRVVHCDDDGKEFISYEKFDSAKYQKSLGLVTDWSLDNLIKAGINPSFPIHTTNPTSLEGMNSVADWSKVAESVLNDDTTVSE